MGLTAASVGGGTLAGELKIRIKSERDKTIALAGNPNVGKSTVFNALTGLHQHTGNWPGKTVTIADGRCRGKNSDYVLVDIPGTYSLLAHSAEEEAARNFICFGGADAAVVVCDAACLERSLNLALQVMEICPKTLICVNLLDEAERRGIKPDLNRLEKELGVPVVGTSAHKKKTLVKLTERLDDIFSGRISTAPRKLRYIKPIEQAISLAEPAVREYFGDKIPPRWLALRLIDEDEALSAEIERYFGKKISDCRELCAALENARRSLLENGIGAAELKDRIVSCILLNAEEAADGSVTQTRRELSKADRLLTSKAFGFPVMILLLLLVFWITIIGANYPSQLLSDIFSWLGERLSELFTLLHAPPWLHGIIVDGAYKVLSWVVAVMLPPMAIFFPLFTLLEDLGYLPRIAYNLDKPFCKCKACGKQALTMCMGLGCNAAGIVGCRIIDSPRERLIAMLTNVFMPCNGRFPMILTVISLFLISGVSGLKGSLLSALILTGVILLGAAATFGVSRLLSATILKGEPSSFTLELPPFRKPQIGKILIRSLLDRTIFVLGRAAAAAAPAGALIWLLANVSVSGQTLLDIVTGFLDPFGRFIGMDGAIITAFLLGLPANEIVIPIIVMAYMQHGSLAEIPLAQMSELFSANGWTSVTAVCVIVFSLMHFPCATSLMTVKKEAGSVKWAALAFAIPTICGIVLCALIASISRLFV